MEQEIIDLLVEINKNLSILKYTALLGAGACFGYYLGTVFLPRQ